MQAQVLVLLRVLFAFHSFYWAARLAALLIYWTPDSNLLPGYGIFQSALVVATAVVNIILVFFPFTRDAAMFAPFFTTKRLTLIAALCGIAGAMFVILFGALQASFVSINTKLDQQLFWNSIGVAGQVASVIGFAFFLRYKNNYGQFTNAHRNLTIICCSLVGIACVIYIAYAIVLMTNGSDPTDYQVNLMLNGFAIAGFLLILAEMVLCIIHSFRLSKRYREVDSSQVEAGYATLPSDQSAEFHLPRVPIENAKDEYAQEFLPPAYQKAAPVQEMTFPQPPAEYAAAPVAYVQPSNSRMGEFEFDKVNV
jgi:hypothetical protein